MLKIKHLIILLLILLPTISIAQSERIKKIVFFSTIDCEENDTLNKYGYIDSFDSIHIPPNLIDKISFKEGFSRVWCDGKCGFIDKKFDIVIPCKYQYANQFYNKLALVGNNDSLFLINSKDSIIEKLEYELPHFINVFRKRSDWIVTLYKNSLYYNIDTNYSISLLEYKEIYYQRVFHEPAFVSKKNLNFDFSKIIKIIHADSCVESYSNYVLYKKGSLYGLSDTLGTIIIPPIYDEIILDYFNEFFFKVRKNSKYGMYFKSYMLIDVIYDDIINRSSLFIVKKDKKFYLLDNNGTFVCNNQIFDYCSVSEHIIRGEFHKSNYRKTFNYDVEYYNWFGEKISPYIFEDGLSFKAGLCPVKLNGKWGCINSTGDFVIEAVYDSLFQFYNDCTFAKLNNKWGLINRKGEKLTEFIFDCVDEFERSVARVCINYKYFYIDQNGKETSAKPD